MGAEPEAEKKTIIEKAKDAIKDPTKAISKTKAKISTADSTITDTNDKIKDATGLDAKSKAKNFIKKARVTTDTTDKTTTDGEKKSSALIKFSAIIMITLSALML